MLCSKDRGKKRNKREEERRKKPKMEGTDQGLSSSSRRAYGASDVGTSTLGEATSLVRRMFLSM